MGLQGGGGQDTANTQKVPFAQRHPSEVRAGGAGAAHTQGVPRTHPEMAMPHSGPCSGAHEAPLHGCAGEGSSREAAVPPRMEQPGPPPWPSGRGGDSSSISVSLGLLNHPPAYWQPSAGDGGMELSLPGV